MTQAKGMMKLKKNVKQLKEIKELINIIESVQDFVSYQTLEADELSRKKRQAGPTNCGGLQDQLAEVRKKLDVGAERLRNNTFTIGSIQDKINTFDQRVNNPATNTTSNQNFLTNYKKLANVAQATNDALNKQLADSRRDEAKLLGDIAACSATTAVPTPPPISKI